MVLHYVIERKEQGCSIRVEERPSFRKVLYWDTLLAAASKEDQNILLFLKKMVMRFASNLQTLPFPAVQLSFSETLEAIRLMAPHCRVIYQKETLRCDWQTSASVFWIGEGGDRFSAALRYRGEDIALQTCELFPHWCICHNKAFPIQTLVPWKWVEHFAKGPVFLEPNQKKRFLEEDPQIIYQSSKPRLLLSDPNGSFANLDRASLEWEPDLLEAGYTRKEVGGTQYFIPSSQALQALLLLIDVGWEIVTANGKQLCRQTHSEWSVREENGAFRVRGSALFGNKKAPLKKGSLWIDLDHSSAGLFDPAKGAPLEGEYEGDALCVRRGESAALFPLLEQEAVDWDEAILQTVRGLKDTAARVSSLPDPSFRGTLLAHQQQGVDWLCFLQERGFSGLLADEMGLGKTVQVLAFFSRLRTNLPILIVAPSSLLFHWRSEIQKFLPTVSVRMYSEQKEAQYVILSYAELRIHSSELAAVQWEAVVLDESGAIKTATTQTAQAACRLSCRFKIALNGTPVENRFEELASQFQFLMPGLVKDIRDARKAQPFLLRRTKDILDLPEKIEQTVFVEMQEEQMDLYRSYCEGLRSGLLRKIAVDGIYSCRMEILEAILRLRQIAADPRLMGSEISGSKLERLLSDVAEILQEKRKILIYSQFSSMLSLIARELQHPFVYLDGSVPLEERGQRVQRFQQDPDMPLFLLTLKAGGVGLNLTSADYVFLFDPWWNDAVENQAIDRAHRIGRHDTVIARRYLAPGTIEEKMGKLKEDKRHLASSLLDTGEEFHWTEESLDYLFSPFF